YLSPALVRRPQIPRWSLWAAAITAVAAATAIAGVGFQTVFSAGKRHLYATDQVTYSGADLAPAVCASGNEIAFSSRISDTQAIWAKHFGTGRQAAVTSGPSDNNPRFSPDCTSIIFTRTEGTETNLYRLVRADGSVSLVAKNVLNADWSGL